MWFEWLVRRRDMGALAAVSPLQPPSGVDQQGSENTIPQSASEAATLLRRQKAERKAPTPHLFPPSPLPGPALLPNDLVSSPTCIAWSPCFDNSPCKDLGYHAGPGGLKALSMSLLGDVASSEGGPWVSEQQQQPFNQLAKNYLQTVQELKQSRFSCGNETAVEPEQLSPRYRELKAGFWKRLANTRCGSHKEDPCDSSSARASDARVEQSSAGTRPSNSTACCKRAARGGPLDRGLNGSVEIEVVLTGKRNGNTLEEAVAVRKPEQDTGGHVQDGACNPCEKGIEHYQEVDVPVRDGNDQSPSATAAERDHDDDVCRTGASSREASDGESLNGETVPTHEIPLHHYQRQEQRQKDGSECSFGSGGGIGRGRIGDDGSPTSTNRASNRQTCEESRASIGNLACNRKEDGTFWSSANWCVVDSYMTGHGKETTWTVRGFEEDDGIFAENSPDRKDRSPLKLFANEKNHSRFSELSVTHFLPVGGPDVETRHGPSPKWTQQALQERVAKNLREQQKEVRCSTKHGLEMVRHSHKQTEEVTCWSEAEDGGREEAECREDVVCDVLMSIGDMLHCRKGRKLLKEAVLTETRDKAGGNIEELPDMSDIQSACISATWKSVRRSSNACVGSSTYGGDLEKELSSMVSRREIQRCKRGWAKRKGKLPATAVACCVSMIGDTVKALRRTREDAAAMALKLAELQAGEMKNLRAAASEMRTHVDLLGSEVQGLEAGRDFNVLVIFPWQQFFRNLVIGISLVSGTLGLHRAIKSLFRLLFGRVGSVQTATSRKEKTMVAMVILCSGSYVGREMWQIFSRVQAKRKTHEAIFQEKLRLALQRISYMSTLTYKTCAGHQDQAENLTDQIALVQ